MRSISYCLICSCYFYNLKGTLSSLTCQHSIKPHRSRPPKRHRVIASCTSMPRPPGAAVAISSVSAESYFPARLNKVLKFFKLKCNICHHGGASDLQSPRDCVTQHSDSRPSIPSQTECGDAL